MKEFLSEEDLIKKHGETPAYLEIDNKVYIQDFYGLNILNQKHNIFNHNYELYNYFRSHNLIMESRKNPEKIHELLNTIDTSSLEGIMNFKQSLTSYAKYINLIKVHINKENLPPEIKDKPIILVHAGEMYNICN